ncbi:MAG: hypothetical protein V8S87_05225 [Oscillospiraceae bacterium]
MILLFCTSMAAWFVSRVGTLVSKIIYYLCVFSMVVPFQMVMYNLAKTADTLKLNTPWTIRGGLPRLRRGACGLHVLRLCQKHTAGDRGGSHDRRLRAFAHVLLSSFCLSFKPTLVLCGVLEIMWIWNDYLLPYLVLDMTSST